MPSNTTQNQTQSPTTVVGNSPDAEISDPGDRERLAKYSHERQAQAMSDARLLAERSQELETELEQGNGETLPAAVFKQADEIIKLAKSVKSKMRPAY
jgi:ketosteroid isomerase-like protein